MELIKQKHRTRKSWILDSGFHVSGTWIPDSNRFIPTSRIPDSTKQNSRIPDATSTNFPDYGMGRTIVTDHLYTAAMASI